MNDLTTDDRRAAAPQDLGLGDGASGLPLALPWLPALADWNGAFARLRGLADPAERLAETARLANHDRDFVVTGKLDRMANACLGNADAVSRAIGRPARRLALLASHSVEHLAPAIRIAGLGRGLPLQVMTAPYGQYRQVILGPATEVDTFRPDAVALLLDHNDAVPALSLDATETEVEAATDARMDEIVGLWRRLRERFGALVIQQTLLNGAQPVFGNYEALVPAAPFAVVARLNAALRRAAQREGVLLLDLDWHAARQGRQRWVDPVRWYHAKQLVSPALAPIYGDLLARVLAAGLGLARKCLVLDLDNTLWGGVIGDDGRDGIRLGQGSAAGEAFLAFQQYCRMLAQRGVILAVCSKNDERIALEAFSTHPEMALKRTDIAAFVANWNDKARNIRDIARTLSIGLDSLVFVDDNPAERAIVRRELPEVAVPELPDDVAEYPARLVEAGYFEAAAFTADDARRTEQYVLNAERRARLDAATDIDGYLKSLEMVMTVQPFASVDMERVTQLTNKTNQFNLTTRRRTRAEMVHLRADPAVLTLQSRLADRFGDNGLIEVVIARPGPNVPETLWIDTWLMSCRVLGRGVEQATLEVLARQATARGATALIGEYIPTAKNGLVAQHYPGLGFARIPAPRDATEGATYWRLDIDAYRPPMHFIDVRGALA
jgi:FkbH-like protein